MAEKVSRATLKKRSSIHVAGRPKAGSVVRVLAPKGSIAIGAVVRRRDFFFEPCAVIFEYEDPEVLVKVVALYRAGRSRAIST